MLILVQWTRRQQDPHIRLEVLGCTAHRSDVLALVFGAVKRWCRSKWRDSQSGLQATAEVNNTYRPKTLHSLTAANRRTIIKRKVNDRSQSPCRPLPHSNGLWAEPRGYGSGAKLNHTPILNLFYAGGYGSGAKLNHTPILNLFYNFNPGWNGKQEM